MSTKITAGIVTYNNSDTIYKCIDSILKCSKNMDFKLYVYDNGSEDGTVEIIRNNFPQVELTVGTTNLGFGRAHNRIVKCVQSKYHVIINPDLFVVEDVFEKMIAYMESHEDVVQMTPEIRNLDGSVQFLPKLDPKFKYVILSKFKPFKHYRSEYTQEFTVFSEPAEVMSATGCFSIVRTDLFKKVQGYDRRYFLYFEDADLSRKLRQHGKIIYNPEFFVYHAWRRDNTRSIKGIFRFLNSMRKYYMKWMLK